MTDIVKLERLATEVAQATAKYKAALARWSKYTLETQEDRVTEMIELIDQLENVMRYAEYALLDYARSPERIEK